MKLDPKPIVDALIEAGETCRRIQEALVDADTLTKQDRSPVTTADFTAQAIIMRTLKEHYPEVPVVAEEDVSGISGPENAPMLERIAGFLPGWSKEDILDHVGGSGSPTGGMFFTLDPIDGTKGFLRREQYAQALALINNGTVVSAWLGCPNLYMEGADAAGVILSATRGEGAAIRSYDNAATSPLAVSGAGAGSAVRFLESVDPGHSDHQTQERVFAAFGPAAEFVRVDSQVKYALLAMGRAEVYLRLPHPETPDYKEKIWDHAAGARIVEEAGGRVTDADGRPLDYTVGKRLVNNRGILATAAGLHDRVLKQLKS